MTSLTAPTVKVPRKRPSAADDAACYRYVEKRDGGICLASRLDTFHVCEGPIQRHHAGLKMGMRKITDPRHVTLLCRGANVGPWARSTTGRSCAGSPRSRTALEREHVHVWQWSIHNAMEWCECGEQRYTATEEEMEGGR